jgi:site-specific DNA recombinase
VDRSDRGKEGGEGSAETSGLVGRLAAAYARVSSDKQEKERTIESQLEALHRGARERGYELAPDMVFVDDGYKGHRLQRPGLERLRDVAAEGACAVVFVHSPDRLARKFAHQAVVLEELKRCGCEVVFLNHPFDQTPEQRMLLQMQGVFAEYEHELIKERTRRGRLSAARNGRINWSGNATYGYKYIRKTDTVPQHLLINEQEAIVVRQMYHWLVDEQMSSYAIQERLTKQDVSTRGNNTQGWAQSTVIKILSNPFYKGEGYYNRYETADARRPRMKRGFKDIRPGNGRSRRLRPREDWIPVKVPAIIDSDLWSLAQEQLAINSERATRHNTKHDYLLRGLLVCGHCGRRLIGAWNPLTKGRYTCSARYPRKAPWRCDARSVKGEQVEAEVWNYVRQILSDPELLRSHYDESHGDPAVDGANERERERLERSLRTLDREVRRLIDAYQAGVIELQELQERRQQVQTRGQMLRSRLQEIVQLRIQREKEIRLLQGLDSFCYSIRDALEEPSFELKRRVLELVTDSIVVEDDRLIIRHVVPVGPVRLQPCSQRRRNNSTLEHPPFAAVACVTSPSACASVHIENAWWEPSFRHCENQVHCCTNDR